MKYNKKNRAIISGLLVGLASIYAVASYFDVATSELHNFLLYTLLLFVIILILAVLAVAVLKLTGKLVSMFRNNHDDRPDDRE